MFKKNFYRICIERKIHEQNCLNKKRGKGKEVVAVCLFFDSSLIAAACSVCEGRLVRFEMLLPLFCTL